MDGNFYSLCSVESVLTVIMDRINGLRSEETAPANINRETKIKDFTTELQVVIGPPA